MTISASYTTPWDSIVFGTPDDMVEAEFPELRIVPQEIWDAAQAQISRRAAQAAKQGNPRAAHRNRYLLSGLLRCACCGAPYVVKSRTHYGCREARKGACTNRQTIRIDRIEARVFARLHAAFLTPEMEQRFDQALREEIRKLETQNNPAELPALKRRLADAIKARANILRAIENGAPYEAFKDRAAEIETEIAAAETCIGSIRQREAHGSALPESSAALFSTAVDRLRDLLGDPDLVDQANQHLRKMIRSITLTPDTTAPDAMMAEILTDLGLITSAAGYAGLATAQTRQLTARQRALPPRALRRSPPGYFGKQETPGCSFVQKYPPGGPGGGKPPGGRKMRDSGVQSFGLAFNRVHGPGGGLGDLDPAGLQRLGDFAHQLDVQHAVDVACALDTDVVG